MGITVTLRLRVIAGTNRARPESVQRRRRQIRDARRPPASTAQTLDEAALAQRLKPSNDTPRQSSFTAPDFAQIHQALKQSSVTLQLLWEDYRDQCPGRDYRYTSFCVQYRAFAKALKRSMALAVR